jgi:ubiquinone/menaquinone biosynthesis C-methylase UbiE
VTVSPPALSPRDLAILDGVLRNELDMAFRRRVLSLLGYLELRGGDRVLDCGCGMGFYLLAMSRLRDLRLTGLDSDADRLRWAERAGVEVELVQGDAQELPFEDAAFDKVLMSEVLEHLEDDGRALREVRRVLRPGGVLAISVPHARYPFWWDPIHRTWAALGGEPIRSGPLVGMWTNHRRLYEPREVEALVRGASFEIEALEQSTHYAFPFSHFLVYGVGKPLVEHGLLPEALRRSADRLSGEQNPGSMVNPINAARAVFRAVDRLNERPQARAKRSFVNVLVKARKPALD